MRLFNKNILLALALLAVAQGCEKEPAGPKDTGVPIMLSATESGTKALLENGTFSATKAMLSANDGSFAKEGNRLVIYDYVDNSTEPYFVDQIGPDVQGNKYGYDEVWPFVHGPHQWTPGDHKFFGWLAKDANFDNPDTEEDDESMTTEAFFALNDNSFNEATKVLSIPAKEITKDTPQFDFMYSNIVTTKLQNSPVPLEFKHLFTAVSFGIKNESSAEIELIQVKVMFYTNQSASINYGVDGIPKYTVNYTPFVFATAYNEGNNLVTLGVSGSNTSSLNNIINLSDNKTYYLSWPQTADKLRDCYIYMEYNKKYSNSTTRLTPTISFPTNLGELEPGKKYHINITIQERADVTIKYLVSDWSTNNVTVPEFN